jgi:hypothetical protein
LNLEVGIEVELALKLEVGLNLKVVEKILKAVTVVEIVLKTCVQRTF